VASVILYLDAFWANSWDIAPYVALREKGVVFSTAVALLREGAGISPPVRQKAITGLEPVLQHGEFWLAESMAILEYIDEAFPAPDHPRLWPADRQQRARARQLMSWIRMEFEALRLERTSTYVFYPRKELPPLGAKAARQAERLLAVVERLAPRSDALFEEWCIADVDVAFMVMRLVKTGHEVPGELRAYAEAVWRRPSVREYVEHARPPNPPSGPQQES
jgi:glutathione S-transferase